MKTTCLPCNNLEGCLEEAQQRSQQRERVGARAVSPTAGGGWQESCLLGDPTGAGSKGPGCCPGSGASSLITAAFVSAFLYPPRWVGPCCCHTGWTKSQTAKMIRLAAISLIKADSFQRRTVSNLGDCNRTRKNKLEAYFSG